MLATLLNQSRSTVTNLICISGGQHQDWTADYRLYSKNRVDEQPLFSHIREKLLENLPSDQPLVVALDDTIIRKTGKKIHGVGWKRDALGPAFQTNLVKAQRYLQFSAAWPLPGTDGEARMVPIDFQHAPSPSKPRKDATEDQQKHYKEALKQQNLNAVSLQRIKHLRAQVPVERRLILNGDGSYTNKTVLRGLPENTIYIGRGRKDMVLHHLPEPVKSPSGTTVKTGRPRRYGAKAPTPEQLRQDESHPWEKIRAFAAGIHHDFKIKTLAPVLWSKSGTDLPLRIVVIAPLGYRLAKGRKMLYRQPAYLICTDPDLPLEEFLQNYLWRWGIEVNFREEKTLIGTGQAQVRGEASNQHLPAVSVAAYGILLSSTLQLISRDESPQSLAQPKWRQPKPTARTPVIQSTGELQRILRHETWAGSLRPGTFYHFATRRVPDAKSEKPQMDLAAHLFTVA